MADPLKTFGRFYLQFLIILAIGIVLAYILNIIFAVDDTEMRVMLSSLFLAAFAAGMMAFQKL